jgi:hypothetical protein
MRIPGAAPASAGCSVTCPRSFAAEEQRWFEQPIQPTNKALASG